MVLPKTGIQILNVPWSATQRTFDTAQECEKMRATLPAPAPGYAEKGGTAKPIERGYYCIGADDPESECALETGNRWNHITF